MNNSSDNQDRQSEPEEKQTYEPPRVESVKLDKDAAEALT